MDFEKIYTEGEYYRNNPGWSAEDSGWKADMIGALIKKNGVKADTVTEVGCGAGKILQTLQAQFPGKRYTGYDISPQAIALARPAANEKLSFVQGNFIDLATGSTDLLLVIDVVEHVADYYGFLNDLRDKARSFIFHIPLDVSCRTVLKPHVNLQQRRSVGHIHYFTEENVWWMLQDCGYAIKDWHYTKPRIDIDKPAGFKATIKKWLRNLSFSISKRSSVRLWGGYSVMVLAEQDTIHYG